MAIVDVASPILSAYFQGMEIKNKKEQLAKQEQLQRDKMAQEQEQFKLQQQHADKILNQTAAYQASQQALSQAKLKHDIEATKAQQTLAEMNQMYQFGVPKQGTGPEAYFDPNAQIPNPEAAYVSPVTGNAYDPKAFPEGGFTGQDRMERRRLEAQRLKDEAQYRADNLANQLAMNTEREQTKRDNAALLAQQHNEATMMRMAIAQLAQGNRSAKDIQRANVQTLGEINKELNRKEYQGYKSLASAEEYLNTEYPKMKGAPGARQLSLVYAWIKNQDNSTVREGELKKALETGAADWTKLGLRISKFTNDRTPILSEKAEAAIIEDLHSKYRVAYGMHTKSKTDLYNRVKRINPDISREDFDTLLPSGPEPPAAQDRKVGVRRIP